ncbi:hypothetical protein ABZS76_33315 [Streptomyces sp. NPDC005562]|uniref:hypothetical protein n=1 Tax=Streptomyces sp. NPDC005562 TaxID=3154890 RepID=UPI0033B8AFCD
MEKLEDGSLQLTMTVDADGQRVKAKLTLPPDEAALINAQIQYLLTQGWARTEVARAMRQQGEIYPVGGSGRLA